METKTELVHIEAVNVGDTVIHHGEEKTVSRNNIGGDRFTGRTLWGDSYLCGREKVKRVLYPKFYAGRFVAYVAQP